MFHSYTGRRNLYLHECLYISLIARATAVRKIHWLYQEKVAFRIMLFMDSSLPLGADDDMLAEMCNFQLQHRVIEISILLWRIGTLTGLRQLGYSGSRSTFTNLR